MTKTKKKAPAKRTRKPVPPVDPNEGVLYTTAEWKGLPNYECVHCAYATVDHQSALEHATDAHGPPPQPKVETVNTGLVTESGTPITRAVTLDEED